MQSELGEKQKIVKFLIIRLSSIGDIVLTTPVIRCLKQQVQGAEIHYIIKKQFVTILQNNPYIDKLHIFDNNLPVVIKELKNESFDYIIDLHKNIRSSIIKSKLKVTSYAFDKINFKKWLIVNFKINKLPKVHIVDRYLETVKIFNIVNDNKGLDYFINEDEEVDLKLFPDLFQSGFAGFVIGANHATKRLPIDKIISIINKINYPIVLLGGKDDYSVAEFIEQQSGKNVYNACGKYSINQSASLVKNSSLIISHDTGLMHIAAAYKKKIISIWGNTIPEFGMYPYLPGSGSEIVEVKPLKCRPCSKIGFKKCPKGHFRCMNDIDIQNINEIFETLINS